MNTEYNKKRFILVLVLALLFLFSMLVVNYRNKGNKKEINNTNDNKVKILNDYSRFFTVNSCVYKYVNYLQSKNVDYLLKVLNQDYVNSHNINVNNVLSNLGELNGNYSFVSKNIYYENLNNNFIKYYVYGYLVKETMDGYGIREDRYFVLNFDINNQLFDIAPSDKLSFEEVIK